ncbi:MAG: hypothetical protein ACLR6A_03570 [Candidatus Gastranaerophilaceae bacterium]
MLKRWHFRKQKKAVGRIRGSSGCSGFFSCVMEHLVHRGSLDACVL